MHSRPRRLRVFVQLLATWVLFGAAAPAREYFVDSGAGSDENDGTSDARPWRTLEQVNRAALQPGDTVRFRRGGIWRGQLIPQSGAADAPITYSAYGAGAKPLLLGSVSRGRPTDWRPAGPGLWATPPRAFVAAAPLSEIESTVWAVHQEGGAHLKAEISPGGDGRSEVRILAESGGSAPHHVQLYNRGLHVSAGDYFVFVFRARSSRPFVLPAIRLSQPSAPFQAYGPTVQPKLAIGPDWAVFEVRLQSLVSATDARLTLALGGALPAGAAFSFQPLAWRRQHGNDAETLPLDVGNIIFNDGQSVGVKKWRPEDVRRPGDYWYNAESAQVLLAAERHPAEAHASIELALRRHIVNQGNRSHVVYEHLALKYGAAHGFGGADTHHLTIRQCDIAWIGGGHQNTTPDGRPVRYGNGVEFWSEAHDNLVEGCRIWEIYDAALTNQGDHRNTQANLVYRHNVIWNCEYSFEYWNGKKPARDAPQRSTTRGIRFEYNTCVNAGYGWGHRQRPDPNGRHLMFYQNPAETYDFVIRHNIFSRATESAVRFANDWTASLQMEHNCWHQPQGTLVQFLQTTWTAGQFADYQARTRLDADSFVADPRFENPEAGDFRLSPGSPAAARAGSGTAIGSQQRLID